MTLVEYELRMEAYQLKQVDRQNEIAQQAWMNQQVQANELKHTRAQVFAKRMAEFKRLKREGKIIPLSERKEGAHG